MVEENKNNVLLVGKVLSVKVKYTYNSKVFYEAMIEVARKSDNKDMLPAIIPAPLSMR